MWSGEPALRYNDKKLYACYQKTVRITLNLTTTYPFITPLIFFVL